MSTGEDDIALKVENVSKKFLLPHQRASSIKSLFINPFRRYQTENQRALDDISFEVKKGEFFGIVGRNGSGKSTLLKCIAGIYQPDRGQVKVNGSLVPFIELGVGFNSDLSGRDNVFLNGAMLGFSRAEMEAMYDEIVEFAEMGRFMDQKLKNYSSGMQVRLAFSIAIRAKGDILLLDEVLAVGDSAFQKKCLDYFRAIKKTDKTIVLVTHGMGTIEEFCDRALMLEDSKIVAIGNPMKISLKYEMSNAAVLRGEAGAEAVDNSIAKIKSVTVHAAGKKTHEFGLDDEVVVDVELDVKKRADLQVSASLHNTAGDYVSGISSKKDLPDFRPKPGPARVSCRFDAGQFLHGSYRLKVVVSTNEEVPKLIDLAGAGMGAETPIILFVEKSEYQKGKFYMSAKWEQGGGNR